MKTFLTLVALGFSLFEIAALQFFVIDLWIFEAVVLILVMVLGFLTIPSSAKRRGKITWLDLAFLVAGVAPCVYVLVEFDRLQWSYGSTVVPLDIVFGAILIAAILELTRRSFGLAMPLVAMGFLAYAMFGKYLPPELFGHTGLKPGNVIGFMIGNMAIFGTIMSVMVQIIFLFMLFSAFLQISGAGDFFVNVSNAIAGRWRGGPAKVAVFSSSLFGTISGSSVANVAVDGGITIPLMIKTGFKPHFAAAVEATASTGGQIMPPVMGAGAFIMAEVLGLTYTNIIVAATIPAILYYFALYWMIDFEALRYNLKGIPRAELPKASAVLSRQGHLLLPIVVLLFSLIVLETSPIRAGLWSSLSIILVSFARRATHMGWRKISEALEGGAKGILEVAATCACAGIIIGVMALTGLGGRISAALIALSGNSLILALFLTMIVSFILGMGLPTTAAYVICASTISPALTQMGVPPLAAHMFIFYFACLSAITPPVALAAFAAAGIAQTGLWGVGLCAVKIAAAGYIIPYMFVYGPALLMIGSWVEIIYSLATACVGTVCLAGGLQGWFLKVIAWPQRILLIIAALGLIKPGWMTDLLGAIILAIVIVSVKMGYYKKEEVAILPPGVR
jgi:TRAP transporter 4TM/12TM fusion protein